MLDKQALKQWAKIFIQNRDAFHKQIEIIEEDEEWDFIAHLKDGTKRLYLAQEPLHIEELLPKLGIEPVYVIVNNSKQNLTILIDHWQELKTFPKLCIIFINPDSDLEKQWMIYPYTHDRITETSALKLGLKSIFESVKEMR